MATQPVPELPRKGCVATKTLQVARPVDIVGPSGCLGSFKPAGTERFEGARPSVFTRPSHSAEHQGMSPSGCNERKATVLARSENRIRPVQAIQCLLDLNQRHGRSVAADDQGPCVTRSEQFPEAVEHPLSEILSALGSEPPRPGKALEFGPRRITVKKQPNAGNPRQASPRVQDAQSVKLPGSREPQHTGQPGLHTTREGRLREQRERSGLALGRQSSMLHSA